MREEVEDLKKEVKEIKKEEESFAMSMLKDYKKQNKRQFIIILVILSMWFATVVAFVYYINTTGYEEITEYEQVVEGDTNSSINQTIGG